MVVEYEPESRLDSYELDTRVASGPTANGAGYEATVSGGGGVYTPTLLMGAHVSDPPEGAEVVPTGEIDDEALDSTLREAAETGEAELHVDEPGAEVERYLDLLASASGSFEPPSEPGDSDTIYADVDGTAVELVVEATRFHGDYGWSARYYVDEHVVRRAGEPEVDPRDGELLECRRRP